MEDDAVNPKEAMRVPALSRQQVRSIDRMAIQQYAMPSICLMENAGSGAAREIAGLTAADRVAVLCGGGNNGGDGFVIARHLQLLGREVRIILLADPDKIQGDALINWKIVTASKIPIQIATDASPSELADSLCGQACIVDAMLGTGAKGNPRGVIANAIQAANATEAVRIAIDLPSGLDCDTGLPGNPCFQADHTCTFVAAKLGFNNRQSHKFTGCVIVVPIGAPADLLGKFTTEAVEE